MKVQQGTEEKQNFIILSYCRLYFLRSQSMCTPLVYTRARCLNVTTEKMLLHASASLFSFKVPSLRITLEGIVGARYPLCSLREGSGRDPSQRTSPLTSGSLFKDFCLFVVRLTSTDRNKNNQMNPREFS